MHLERELIAQIARVVDELEAAEVTTRDLSEFDVADHLSKALTDLEDCQIKVDLK